VTSLALGTVLSIVFQLAHWYMQTEAESFGARASLILVVKRGTLRRGAIGSEDGQCHRSRTAESGFMGRHIVRSIYESAMNMLHLGDPD